MIAQIVHRNRENCWQLVRRVTTISDLLQPATVAQLVDSAGGVVSKIRHVARTARQNKRECVYLANRISTIATALPLLHQQDHEVAQSLVGLSYALKEAHDLIIACCLERQRKTAPLRQLFRAGGHAERFREINARIDSYLILIPLLTHISLIVPSSNHAGVPTIPMVTPGSGSGSSSLQLESLMVPYVNNGTLRDTCAVAGCPGGCASRRCWEHPVPSTTYTTSPCHRSSTAISAHPASSWTRPGCHACPASAWQSGKWKQ
ncbi:uncharacterized protein LOC104582391 isoform X2 [Brachypodium distachyon]|uniref:uncharacterized protein LOC104582391 isoform X2 n=1 Tax=Brachypodium distachyon TaxID=15368 RepID=UPI000D0D3658|nr:uncharacterized protein LOC104582391 isoform X2 [Brachypodium distachyon]|eukprot:XP_024311670.1 uncharacterized protein LOC104582391 isoform X2 [Brachypodium distachyon]